MKITATAQPDVTLFLDAEGVIREAAFSNTLSGESAQAWTGLRWVDTVTGTGTAKIERLVADARTRRVSAFRQVAQRFPSGIELLMEYTAVRLGPKAGIVAVGKSLQSVVALQASVVAAQQAVERDYWRLRNVETRYRLLFNASSEASLMVEAAGLRILEANGAALIALRPGGSTREAAEGRIEGGELAAEFSPADREGLLAMLHRVREHGSAPAVLAHAERGGSPFTVRANLLKSEPSAVFLLQLSPVGRASPRTGRTDQPSADLLMERHPYGFAILRRDGSIVRANRAFLELVQIGAEAWAAGERLSRWLEGSALDLERMIEEAAVFGVGRVLVAPLRGQLGREMSVEVAATTAAGEPGTIGVTLRPFRVAASLADVAELFGRQTLRQTLRDIARVVERQCVEKALELRQGDAAAAAAVLGLSLRSFQSRLRRLGGSPAGPIAASPRGRRGG